MKQNFPLRYFYGESANAIKIQIWVTLIANLLLMVMQKRIRRTWSFSNLATMFRIMLMYYVNCYTFFEEPEKDSLLGPPSLQGPLPEIGGGFPYFCRFHVTFSCFPYYINGKVCIFAIEMYNCIGRTL